MTESCGALIQGDHFVYASGEHGDGWVAKDIINLDPSRPKRLGELLAEAVWDIPCDVVCGPAIGGLICAHYTALALGTEAVYAERTPAGDRERFTLRRGHDLQVEGRRVLLVDDVVNTGHSIRLAMEAVSEAGGVTVGAAAWISRGNVRRKELGVPTYTFLEEIALPSWPAADCPLCKVGKPVNVRYAHGAEFLARPGHGSVSS